MSNLSTQRRIAAVVTGAGQNRLWFDPEKMGEIEAAISRDDIRTLLGSGTIKVLPAGGSSKGRSRIRKEKRAYGHRRGPGRRKGAQGARAPRKRSWIQRIRAIRRSLRAMRDEGVVNPHLYRLLYRKASGGEFRNVGHLKSQVETISGRSR
ncbi:MAG: 50S ribosomal protein L19e [Methanomicrobiales archaeon]|nr:50S ribosomal protein L19e [Methanomicrobiales archaeon]